MSRITDLLRAKMRRRRVLPLGGQDLCRAMDDWMGMAVLLVQLVHAAHVLGRTSEISLSREANCLLGIVL